METKRPTNPAAEEILGGYFPVLDHGFVALVDYMGSDDSIERAARVSYGYGTRARSHTRGLIRYLRRHRHTTPSEMVEIKLHCAMPIFVARQWVRHRSACLAAGTEICFDLPRGLALRGRRLYKIAIEELWRRFQPTRNRTRPDKQRNPHFRRDRVKSMLLRQMDEESGRIRHTRIVDVFRNGRKPVFRMRLVDGKQIEATADHRFCFADGWSSLHDATGLHERGGRAVWNTGDYYVYVNGAEVAVPAAYRNGRWLDHQYNTRGRSIAAIAEMCGCSRHTVQKWLHKHGIKDRRGRGGFLPGHRPWNVGRTYRLGPRRLSEKWIAANRRSRTGAASNFWRGGITSKRDSIGRWTTQAARRVHQRNAWTCQLCGQPAADLHCHHIVPVWADESLAWEESNLTTLCATCHRRIGGRELEYADRLGGSSVRAERVKRPRAAWNKLTVARLVRIASFEYVGERETFDLEVEGPFHNFVANGIVTHNSVNEYSARYSLMPLLFYRPEPQNFALQSASNRQGRDAVAPPATYVRAIERWEELRRLASETYGWLVEEDVARELARIDLPLSTYTQWYWKIDLHNLFHFLTLRVDPHAQWEIREYGRVIAGILKRVAPLSYEAWLDYEVAGIHLSRGERGALRALLDASPEGLGPREGAVRLSPERLAEFGLSPREVRELLDKLGPFDPPDFELDLSRMRPPEEFEARMREAVPGDFG